MLFLPNTVRSPSQCVQVTLLASANIDCVRHLQLGGLRNPLQRSKRQVRQERERCPAQQQLDLSESITFTKQRPSRKSSFNPPKPTPSHHSRREADLQRADALKRESRNQSSLARVVATRRMRMACKCRKAPLATTSSAGATGADFHLVADCTQALQAESTKSLQDSAPGKEQQGRMLKPATPPWRQL